MEERLLVGIRNYDESIQPLLVKQISDYSVFKITPERFGMQSGKVVEEILNTILATREYPLKIKNKHLIYCPQNPIYYEVLYKNKSISFNYVIPNNIKDVLVNKIDNTFRTATIKEAEDYFPQFAGKYHANFIQKNHFMFSLNADYRENNLINGLLGVVSNMEKEDVVLLQIGILPQNDNWKEIWKRTYAKHKKGEEINIHKNIPLMIADTIFNTADSVVGILDMVMNVKPELQKQERFDFNHRRYRQNYATLQKINYNGYLVQIKLFCNNDSKIHYYSKIFDGVFKVLDAEQELIIDKISRYKKKERHFGKQLNKNIFSTKELSIFLQLPNRRMLVEYSRSIKSIEVLEVNIPKQLLNGKIPIGTAQYKGNRFMTYWNTKDKNMAPMHKVITGLQRTGKTSYIKNFAIDAIKTGDSVFIVDTIKNCELANDIRDYLPPEHKDKVIVLDFNDLDYLRPLAWNELRTHNKPKNIREELMLASMMSGNLKRFLETVGELKDDRFSPRMLKYLSNACKLVFSQPNTNIKDIVDCLIEAPIRDKFIKQSGLPKNSTIIQDLRRLDDGRGGTNYNEIAGIVDRASVLLNDYTMEMLLSIPPNDKIDFTQWANEGKCVVIKMSDLTFNRDTLQALVTFIYSKIWMAMLARGNQDNPKLAHVILDEIHNFPQVCDMLKLTCREAAKFGLSYIFTSHSLLDLRGLLPFIKASGANFMLFKTTKENLKLLQEELELGGFDMEQCLKVKDYHTINIVNYDRDYVVYTSKVVDPVDKRYTKYDRKHLDIEHSKRFGKEIKMWGM